MAYKIRALIARFLFFIYEKVRPENKEVIKKPSIYELYFGDE